MLKSFLLFLFLTFFPLTLFAQATPEERYGPTFYGIELPKTGARVLLIVDASKSMRRKDTRRIDGGTRWDTLVDEVKSMSETMTETLQQQPLLCYTVTLLFDVGSAPHTGTQPYNMANPAERQALLSALEGKSLGEGGNYRQTFGEVLWPLVSKQHITHIVFLGDNDIARYSDEILPQFSNWYSLSMKKPKDSHLRSLWQLKHAWWSPWKNWRPPNRAFAKLKREQIFPPPPKEVTFSAVVIGQTSPLLRQLTELGQGSYVEYKNKKKKKASR